MNSAMRSTNLSSFQLVQRSNSRRAISTVQGNRVSI